ncbi:MAG: glutamine-hydrolyzing carbamoyl-phosphate synthase small subunit [Candidatus Micrarchaeaceae archaeon]
MYSEKAYLYLEDGTIFEGASFGARKEKEGEVVFSTAMNGYVESLTDPSYKGQILVLTHPLIGNYGVPERKYVNGILENFESERIQIEGLVVTEHTLPFKWNSKMSLDEWLKSEGIPGIYGIDTRSLVIKLRDKGVMMGKIMYEKKACSLKDYEDELFIKEVSAKRPIIYENKGKSIVLLDFGVKHGILCELNKRGFRIIRLPFNCNLEEILSFDPKGIVISNGPGNPNLLKEALENTKRLLEEGIPILGICLGHQIAVMALGGKVKKLKFGHRAINKPVIELTTKRSYITTHNHGYGVVESEDLPEDSIPWFICPDDNTIEGMLHKSYNLITVQFHPEGRPGPTDASWVFDKFAEMLR